MSKPLVRVTFVTVVGFAALLPGGCGDPKQSQAAPGSTVSRKPSVSGNVMVHSPGTFGHTVARLMGHTDVLVLHDGYSKSKVAVAPRLQGRVMTSTMDGDAGASLGWVNLSLIESGKRRENFNAWGGEDRFWLGPEGGPFGFFFRKDRPFTFENWQAPEPLDVEPWEIAAQTEFRVQLRKRMKLVNHAGTPFDMLVTREVRLISAGETAHLLGVALPHEMRMVAFESINRVTNKGEAAWSPQTGLPAISAVGAFEPSPAVTVIVPFITGSVRDLGPVVRDDYFRAPPSHRLRIDESRGVIYYRADGLQRSKFGVSPRRAKPVMASYDADRNLLTLIQFTLPANAPDTPYVDSRWRPQSDPLAGDVVAAHNDGPSEIGPAFGPYFELQSCSPAAMLAPGKTIRHMHRTIHLTGTEAELDIVARSVLGVTLADIAAAWR